MSVPLPSNLDMHSGDPFTVTLTYNGTTLSETITDNSSGASFSTSYAVDIPTIVGGSTAFVGFTGATGGLTANQDIQTWTGTFGPPSTGPTLTSLSSTSATEGTGSVTLTLSGSNFVSNSTAQFNGTSLATTFLNSGQLVAVIPASFLAEEGTGAITVFNPSSGNSSGALGFTITDAPLTGSPVTSSASEGIPFTGPVATFTDANPNAPVSDFTATINWGNGMTSTGTVTALGGGNFSVSGTNVYGEGGTYGVTVGVTDIGGAATTVTNTVQVADAPITATGMNVNPTEGVAFSTVVAAFADADSSATPASYSTVLITWGDGQQSTGTVIANPSGGFLVLGNHTYAEEGTYLLQVIIQDLGGATATTTSAAQVADAPLTPSGVTITPSPGATFTGVVATFIDTNSNPDINDFSATILWGDTNSSTGTIIPDGNGGFIVIGSNTYQASGTYAITVVLTDLGGSLATAMSTAIVGGGAAASRGGRGITGAPVAAAGQQFQVGMLQVSSNAESALLPVQSRTSPANDMYWQILSQQRGDWLTDANGWIANELALALQGSAVS
jgi:hypothetical protein